MSRKICILYGGPSSESAVSLRSATRIHQSFLKSGERAEMVEYSDGVEEILKRSGYDIVFNIMHGRPGEDGRVQSMLERLCIPYTGSGVIASALTMNKFLTQKALSSMGVPVLDSVFVSRRSSDSAKHEAAERFRGKVIIKPNTGGSSVGTIIVDKDDIESSAERSLREYSELIIEEYVEGGQEITVGVIEENGRPRVLTPLELRPKNKFYDYEAKYTSGKTDFIIPPKLPEDVITRMKELTKSIFENLNLRSFARVDFIAKGRDVFELEVNSVPGMTDLSDLPQEAEFDGIPYGELVLRILETAGVNKDA